MFLFRKQKREHYLKKELLSWALGSNMWIACFYTYETKFQSIFGLFNVHLAYRAV